MYTNGGLTASQAAIQYPVLRALPHASRSAQYEHIPTVLVLKALEDRGFLIHSVEVAGTRDPSRDGYQKHLVRLRRPEDMQKGRGLAPELLAINSHDGSCAYNLVSGIIQFICGNGLIVGEKWGSVRIAHKGMDTLSDVMAGSDQIVEQFGPIMENIETMKQIKLERDEQIAFAQGAVQLRYSSEELSPVTPEAFLSLRRAEDRGESLWTIFNRVQENMIRGGLKGRHVGENGKVRRTTVRAINSIDGQTSLNRALWTLTEKMAELKGVKLITGKTLN